MSTEATSRSSDAPLWFRLAPRAYRRAWRRMGSRRGGAIVSLDDDASLAAAAGSAAVDRHAFRVGLRSSAVGLIAFLLVAVIASVDLDAFVHERPIGDSTVATTVHRRMLEIGALVAAPMLTAIAVLRTRSIQLRQRRRRVAMLIEPASIPSAASVSNLPAAPSVRSSADVLLVASRHERLTEATIRDLNGWQGRVLLGALVSLAAAAVLSPWVDMMRAAGSFE